MQNDLMYRDLIILVFENKKNYEYFKKYYSNSRNYQIMLRDYIKMTKTEWGDD